MLSTLEKNPGTWIPLYRFRCPNIRLQVAFGFDIEIVRYYKKPSQGTIKESLAKGTCCRNEGHFLTRVHMLSSSDIPAV